MASILGCFRGSYRWHAIKGMHVNKGDTRANAAETNPHATFCGNRGRATASGDPVGGAARLPPIPIHDPKLPFTTTPANGRDGWIVLKNAVADPGRGLHWI